ICDKKNRVLFTDTDCLVLSKDFMLPDESMVVLRVLRKHNLYTIDKTLFLKKHKRDIILVQVYVDDIIFGSTKKAV
ncbi:hypothetical protein Tco_1303515, partial [Tanacetum coccineum]